MNEIKLYEGLHYPGNYIPIHNDEEIMEELRHSHEGDMLLPPFNLTEHSDYFRIEIAAPGLRQEDFLVETDDNVVSISVLHRDEECKRDFQVHEYNYECFKRNIVLPLSAETAFTVAEYKNGLLRMIVPKGDKPLREIHSRVAVY